MEEDVIFEDMRVLAPFRSRAEIIEDIKRMYDDEEDKIKAAIMYGAMKMLDGDMLVLNGKKYDVDVNWNMGTITVRNSDGDSRSFSTVAYLLDMITEGF